MAGRSTHSTPSPTPTYWTSPHWPRCSAIHPPPSKPRDSALNSRGYRAMAGIPRLQFAHVDLLVRTFGSLQGLLAASATDLQSVDGIGAMWAGTSGRAVPAGRVDHRRPAGLSGAQPAGPGPGGGAGRPEPVAAPGGGSLGGRFREHERHRRRPQIAQLDHQVVRPGLMG